MPAKITFVGAGPGAADLITIRGAEALKQADLVIYAGSLVNEQLLDYVPSQARRLNSAEMDFLTVIREIRGAYEAGLNVVRLHTGDPAIYGAVSEQYRELDRLGLPYEVVPGVSSALAVAASLKVEYTVPRVSQSVIFTRSAGRTPVPAGEALEKLATHGCTLCIFLSIGEIRQLAQKLIDSGLDPLTPVAVVYRASWSNEQVVRGVLSNIADRVELAGIKRQSIIVIGRVLGSNGELSRLYSRDFTHGYRNENTQEKFEGRCAVFGLSSLGVSKAVEIVTGLGAESKVLAPDKYAKLVPSYRLSGYPAGGFSEAFAEAWKNFEALVLVGATGIAVRQVARLCKDKKTDPAVVVCDESGTYAISLLSGHLGGANRLARMVAGITGGKPVITTATDGRGLMAFDELASQWGYVIENPEAICVIASAQLEGDKLELTMPQELFVRYYEGVPGLVYTGSLADGRIQVRHPASGTVLKMLPGSESH